MGDALSVFTFRAAGAVIRLLPLKLVQRLGKLLGRFFFYFIPVRKRTALSNLDICFPERSLSEKKKILRSCYENLGIDLVEFLWFPNLNHENCLRLVKYNNGSNWARSIDEGNCLFFVSGHFSNWELLAYAYPILHGKDLNIIAKRQANKKLNKLVNRQRELSGNRIIETGLTLKETFRVIKNKEPVCFLADQAGHPDFSAYVSFFGKNVPSFQGPAKLALTERSQIEFVYILREADYSYIVHSRSVDYSDLHDNSKENTLLLTARIQKELERTIREHPEQWLWLHKRFKHVRD